MLESWLQQIAEVPVVLESAAFTTFLLEAQEEVKTACEEVELEVFLVNGKSIKINALSTDQTDEVLEMVCAKIQLNPDFTYAFGLVVVECEAGSKAAQVFRTMQHFESPYIALQREGMETKQIQLRKAYWDTDLDWTLAEDAVAGDQTNKHTN